MKCADCKFFVQRPETEYSVYETCRIELPRWLTDRIEWPVHKNVLRGDGCDLGQALDLKPGPQDEAQRP